MAIVGLFLFRRATCFTVICMALLASIQRHIGTTHTLHSSCSAHVCTDTGQQQTYRDIALEIPSFSGALYIGALTASCLMQHGRAPTEWRSTAWMRAAWVSVVKRRAAGRPSISSSAQRSAGTHTRSPVAAATAASSSSAGMPELCSACESPLSCSCS